MAQPSVLQLLVAGVLASIAASAQESTSNEQATTSNFKVWSAIAFVNHGDTTPFLLNQNPILTPDGAQQLHRQGQAFRSRYLTPPSAKNTSGAHGAIQGISQNGIDNTQLRILSQADSWAVGGALAFMQGLYPPNSTAFNDAAGGQTLAENHIDSNTTSYPLDGYQYPQIETLSGTDVNSIAIQGHVSCPAWQAAATTNLTTNPTLKDAAQKSADFYNKLFSTGVLQGVIDADDANFFNAYDIYNLVNYEYMHNATVFANLTDADSTRARLAKDAFTMERAKSDPGSSNANDTASVTLTIAGRTFAREVATQMTYNSNKTSDEARRVTLMFGSFEPMMAFFSIAGLLSRENVMSTAMGNVIAPGAALVFELIGQDPEDSSRFPEPEDQNVRLLYRPTADEKDTFQEFSLFGSGNDGGSIPYVAFRDKMNEIGRDAVDWCQICKPGSAAAWCQDVPDSGNKESKYGQDHSGMSPAVAGIIGAVIMGALITLIGLAVCALGGFRFRGRSEGDIGAEKKTGDQDVQYGNGGDAHARVGSWEMRDGRPGSHERHLHIQPSNQFDDESEADIGGAAPVRAREAF